MATTRIKTRSRTPVTLTAVGTTQEMESGNGGRRSVSASSMFLSSTSLSLPPQVLGRSNKGLQSVCFQISHLSFHASLLLPSYSGPACPLMCFSITFHDSLSWTSKLLTFWPWEICWWRSGEGRLWNKKMIETFLFLQVYKYEIQYGLSKTNPSTTAKARMISQNWINTFSLKHIWV